MTFLLQIVYPDGTVVRGAPGRANPFECDLIEACIAAILTRSVGLGRTEAHVAAAIEQGMTEAILSLKKKARTAPSKPNE